MRLLPSFACLAVSVMAWNPAVASELESEAMQRLVAVTTAATENRYALEFDGATFSGPAWERLVSEGQKAHFFLIGEEHGIAENPKLAAQLFTSLAGSGYSRLAIEISPPMARIVDRAILVGGEDGLRDLFSRPGGEPAFFGMDEEAKMLVSVRAAVPPDQPALWGADYEVAGDLALLRQLQNVEKPEPAQVALDALTAASEAAMAKFRETGSFQFFFTFSGDPQLVRDVKKAWPERDDESAWILDSLEETLEINQLWVEGDGAGSNARRADFLRNNFLRYWRLASERGLKPRVMLKFGASHMIRGLTPNKTFDLGSLVPEIAAVEGVKSFSVMVVPGKGSKTAVFNPSNWSYEAREPKDDYNRGIEPLINAAHPDRFTLIELEPVRRAVSKAAKFADPALIRTTFGYDMLLVMSGSMPSGEFEHE